MVKQESYLDAIVVKLSGDGFPPVKQVKQVPKQDRIQFASATTLGNAICRSVPGLLMVNFEYGPECLNLPFALMVLSLGLSHLPLQLLQGRLNQPESVSYPHEQICKRSHLLPTLWRGLLVLSPHFGHFQFTVCI